MEPRSSTDLLEAVAAKLSLLLPEVVFVGGCTTQLLITDPAATPARMSDDVDMIVEASSYAEYSEFSERLQGLGFSEDSSDGAPICRWTLGGMKLDVLPTDAKTLGFSSRWYKEAVTHAQTVSLGNLQLRVVTPPYFLATKLEALKGRGKQDYLASRDLEDIVAVIDGRPTILQEVNASNKEVRAFLRAEVGRLLKIRAFIEALPAHVAGDEVSQKRIPGILATLKSLSDN